jgi:hypothetical protein
MKQWLRHRRFHRRTKPCRDRRERRKDCRPFGPQQVGEVSAVGEPGRVDAGLVHLVGVAQGGEGGIDEPQVAVPVLATFRLPAGETGAARQTLEVDDESVRPGAVQVDVLEVPHAVTVAVKRQHERRPMIAGARRRGRVDDRLPGVGADGPGHYPGVLRQRRVGTECHHRSHQPGLRRKGSHRSGPLE